MDDAIQSAWLAAIQSELGVLKTNLMLRDVQFEVAEARIVQLTVQVDAYRARVDELVKANDELKVTIRADRKKVDAFRQHLIDTLGIDLDLEA